MSRSPAHGHRPGEPARDGALGPRRVPRISLRTAWSTMSFSCWVTLPTSTAGPTWPTSSPCRSSGPSSSSAWYIGALRRVLLRVGVLAVFAVAALLISEYIAKPLVQERFSGALSFPSGNVTAVCATALAMWLALYPVLGNVGRGITFAFGAVWTLLMSLAVIGAFWHTPLDGIGSILLSVGVVTAGAALLAPRPSRAPPGGHRAGSGHGQGLRTVRPPGLASAHTDPRRTVDERHPVSSSEVGPDGDWNRGRRQARRRCGASSSTGRSNSRSRPTPSPSVST